MTKNYACAVVKIIKGYGEKETEREAMISAKTNQRNIKCSM